MLIEIKVAADIRWIGTNLQQRPGEDINCPPATRIRELMSSGKLPEYHRVASSYLKGDSVAGEGKGDCHPAARWLMFDLVKAKEDGWSWVSGTCLNIGEHSWCECGDWAVDCATGRLLFVERWKYRRVMRARGVRVRGARETMRWLIKRGRIDLVC